MSDPMEPPVSTPPPAPPPVANSPVANPPPPTPPSPTPTLAAFDAAARLILGGAAAVFIVTLVGLLIGAWELQPFAIVMLLLAIVAAAAAYSAQAMTVSAAVKPWQPFAQLAAGAVATALAGLALVEMLGDLDDLDDYGGMVGLVLGVALVVAAAAMLWGAVRSTAVALRPTQVGARLAAIGAGLVLLAWVLHLTIGFWAFGPAVWGLGAILLASVLLLTSGEFRLPAWTGWVALVLGVIAAWVALGQWGALMDLGADQVELGLGDYLPFLVYVAGILLVIAGAAVTATGGRLAMPSTRTGDGGGGDPSAPSAGV